MTRWFEVRSRWALWVTPPACIALIAVLVVAARALGGGSGWFAFIVVWWPMVWVGSMSRLVQVRLPPRYHAIWKFERNGRLWEAMGAGVAKAVLRRPPFTWFNPGLHLPRERTQAEFDALAQRMCDAEASHAVLFVATLPVVAHALARGWWSAAALTVAFDVVMNGYPVILQRTNRAHLAQRFS